jgi:hypothetical protein
MDLYTDRLVTLDDEGITIRRYRFPTGSAKRIRYDDVRGVRARPLGMRTGRWRLWGSAGRTWLPLDNGRPRRPVVIDLDVGGWLHPGFTPDDPDRALAVLTARTRRP